MKLQVRAASLSSVLLIALIASTAALAKHSVTVKLPYAGSLNGTPIPAGEYNVSWVQHSPEATVTVAKGKEVVGTAQGKWVKREVRYPTNQVLYGTNPDGSRRILEIRFEGRKDALVFGTGSPTSQRLVPPAEGVTVASGNTNPAAKPKRMTFLGKPGHLEPQHEEWGRHRSSADAAAAPIQAERAPTS